MEGLERAPSMDSTAVKAALHDRTEETRQGATRNREVVRCRVEASSLARRAYHVARNARELG